MVLFYYLNEGGDKLKVMSIRIPADLAKEVEKYAKQTERSINKAIIYLLRMAMEKEKK